MKTLIAALLIVSTSAFAQELDATEALLSAVPAGAYSGVTTDSGSECSVSVTNFGNKVTVVASADGLTKRYAVASGSVFSRPLPRFRSFLSSTPSKTLRTVPVEENTQYIVVAETVNGFESKVECVINL